MRATLLVLVAAFVCAATGCANLNLARRGGCDARACAEPVACAKPVGCAQPIGCAAAVSSAGPAGVSPYDPAMAATPAPAVSPYIPAAAPYDPGYGGYGGGFDPRLRRPLHQHRIPYGNPGAVVAYPYYTIRGPRDFLLDNPPSIGR